MGLGKCHCSIHLVTNEPFYCYLLRTCLHYQDVVATDQAPKGLAMLAGGDTGSRVPTLTQQLSAQWSVATLQVVPKHSSNFEQPLILHVSEY